MHCTKRHRPPKTIKCSKCSRQFKNASALQQHVSSSVHRPLSKLRCMTAPCRKMFSAPSGLLHHLESGSCLSGMDRMRFDRVVVAHDTHHLITQEEGSGGGWLSEVNNCLAAKLQVNETRSCDWTQKPSIYSISPVVFSSGEWTPQSNKAASDEWAELVSQSFGNRCPFCPPGRRFTTMVALRNHLQSPVHSDPIFSCPTALVKGEKQGK